MLGIVGHKPVIKGKQARKIIECVKRAYTNNLTDYEKQCNKRLEEARSKYKVEW